MPSILNISMPPYSLSTYPSYIVFAVLIYPVSLALTLTRPLSFYILGDLSTIRLMAQTLHSSTVPFINFPLIFSPPPFPLICSACLRFPTSVNKQTKPRSDEW